MSRARGIGLEVELVGPEEALRLMPRASPENLYGGVWVPGDGHLDPHTATHALADAARALGRRDPHACARDGDRARARGAR